MATFPLSRVESGKQSVWGTAVALSHKLMALTEGGATFDVHSDTHQADNAGSLAPSKNAAEVAQWGEFPLRLDGSYQEALFALAGIVAGVRAGANPYTWTYNLPNATAPVPQLLTFLLAGDYGDSWLLDSAIPSDLHISGEAGGIWMLENNFFGRRIVQQGSGDPAATADSNVNFIRMADTAIYLDVEGATPGTTIIADNLRSFDLNVDVARSRKVRGNSLYPTGYNQDRLTGTLDLTVEYNATWQAVINVMLTNAPITRQVRILATEPGATGRTAQIDFNGFVRADPMTLFESDDGTVLLPVTIQGAYNSTNSYWCKVVIGNTLSALP